MLLFRVYLKNLTPALVCILSILANQIALAADSSGLSSSTQLSHDGVVTLSWNINGEAEIALQQAQNKPEEYTTLYMGKDTASVISGLSDGDYFFRIGLKQPDGSFSYHPPLKVQVEHHPLATAWMIFAIGALVFLSTVILIFRGSRVHAND
jgi:hypothetical protein